MKWQDSLKSFLESHEDDVAYGINDWYELKPVFLALMGREPEHDRHESLERS